MFIANYFLSRYLKLEFHYLYKWQHIFQIDWKWSLTLWETPEKLYNKIVFFLENLLIFTHLVFMFLLLGWNPTKHVLPLRYTQTPSCPFSGLEFFMFSVTVQAPSFILVHYLQLSYSGRGSACGPAACIHFCVYISTLTYWRLTSRRMVLCIWKKREGIVWSPFFSCLQFHNQTDQLLIQSRRSNIDPLELQDTTEKMDGLPQKRGPGGTAGCCDSFCNQRQFTMSEIVGIY